MKTDTSINYFYSLIDRYGIIQFSKKDAKDLRFGYAIEDQARALIVALRLQDAALIRFFTEIILKARATNGVKMLWDKKGRVLSKEDHFEDASAEVVWAIGEMINAFPGITYSNSLKKLYQHLIAGIIKTDFTRVISYALLGTTKLEDKRITRLLADKLMEYFWQTADGKWAWFEEKLIYANALLPWSLFLSYRLTKDKKYLKVAMISLDFLLAETKWQGIPIAIGNKGWWRREGKKSLYDQQPIDIAYACLCLLDAFDITGQKRYLEEAVIYFDWFSGNNMQGINMIRSDGGCRDGLNRNGVNLNSGAESQVCYLLAALAIRPYRNRYICRRESLTGHGQLPQ